MLKWSVLLIAGGLAAFAAPNIEETEEYWLRREAETLRQIAAEQPITGQAKNVILFIGDGMGVSTVTAARILAGQQAKSRHGGEEHQLAMEKLPWSALSKTYSVNQQTSDSAPKCGASTMRSPERFTRCPSSDSMPTASRAAPVTCSDPLSSR